MVVIGPAGGPSAEFQPGPRGRRDADQRRFPAPAPGGGRPGALRPRPDPFPPGPANARRDGTRLAGDRRRRPDLLAQGAAALHRPAYTVRHIDPAAGWLETDIFIHDGGRACDFAISAAPGTPVGLTGPEAAVWRKARPC
ncbi:siderophore-interacting protein [Paracoccus sp. SSK6]|uniref:siderophore-interacting protein n=1 Tax=Paracoccus sp. SSK6 TaxID=3143131 RepID=UPI0032197B4C